MVDEPAQSNTAQQKPLQVSQVQTTQNAVGQHEGADEDDEIT